MIRHRMHLFLLRDEDWAVYAGRQNIGRPSSVALLFSEWTRLPNGQKLGKKRWVKHTIAVGAQVVTVKKEGYISIEGGARL